MTVIPDSPTSALRLVPLQRLTAGGRWRSEAMRSYRAPLLLWFTRGQGRITLAGSTRGFGAHNAVFVPPGTMHGIQGISQLFGTAAFFGPQAGAALPEEPLHLRIRDAAAQAELTSLLDAAQRELSAPRPGADRALGHHAGLISVWLDRQADLSPREQLPKTAATALARRFTLLIEDQLMTGLSVSDYAEMLDITPTHLSRVCRQTCGKSASELLQDRLAFEARRLLIDTSLPIRRVAEVLGYRSAAYFTRAFHARTGETPSQFRRMRQTSNAAQ